MPSLSTSFLISQPSATFFPALKIHEPSAEHWLRQVTIRLRREICWLWHERGWIQDGSTTGFLPPFVDRLGSVLDLARYADEKRLFFEKEATAAYLSDLLQQPGSTPSFPVPRGSFSWVVRQLELSPLDCFVLALALSPVVDSAIGTVIASCLNDPARTFPSLALAQRLWEEPDAVLSLADPEHRLYSTGLISSVSANPGNFWEQPLTVPSLVARRLLYPAAPEVHSPLRSIKRLSEDECARSGEMRFVSSRLASDPPNRLRVIPLVGQRGTHYAEVATAIATDAGFEVAVIRETYPRPELGPQLTLAWLCGKALLIPQELLDLSESATADSIAWALPELPVTLFLALRDRSVVKRMRGIDLLQIIEIPPLSFDERLALWRQELRVRDDDLRFQTAIGECARRFRYQKETIRNIASGLRALDRTITESDLITVCRGDVHLGELAKPVSPRFSLQDIVLPVKQAVQIREIIHGMGNLTRVHYQWGTAEAWNESGLTALFAGPPGTGKTMAAEVIATELNLPLYRIDLSQVVNKYIGETEKNLARIFDAADKTDLILFFDEADALLGKRTEVKDAHDRYANLEVSYLLERMERFKGLAILATNRRKDLDDAFIRRLRFAVEFPLPGPTERLQIWRRVIPPNADASELDFAFLANQFALTGGHIRAIVFHACLQAAAAGSEDRRLTMPTVVRAVKQEYDKLERNTSLEQFGAYASSLEDLT